MRPPPSADLIISDAFLHGRQIKSRTSNPAVLFAFDFVFFAFIAIMDFFKAFVVFPSMPFIDFMSFILFNRLSAFVVPSMA